MRRPVLLFLCISLAWTLACATAIGTDGERRLWQRQLASTSAKFTLVQTAATTSADTAAAVRTTAVTSAAVDETTTGASTPSSSIAETVSSELPASSSAVAPTTSVPASASSEAVVASSRTARQLSAAQSSIALSSISASSASASSASAKASAAAAKAESSFLQPGNRLFPVAVLMFIAIGIIGIMIGIFIIKKCCHRRRFADPRDYAVDSDWEKRAGSPTQQVGLLDSPDSFNSDEKSGAWNQQDAGMRMNKGGLNFVPQPYQQPSHSAASPPRSSNSTRAHQTHRRTATIILPPTPAVIHTPTRQPSHPPHSLRPSSPLTLNRTSSPSVGNATPPSRIHRVPVPTFDEASNHARSRSLATTRSLPLIPPPIPMKRPFPPVPAAAGRERHQRAATIAVLPHQPKDGSGLRYLYGERSSSRAVNDLDLAGHGTFGRRMGSAEGRVLG
ncbi:hypothetical protein BCR35DRAFT_352167 [Leucosporidium creatinivorum]|uniref:Mid2 domain-containing protein n=1 Tax=Leucosporidium creatinivorum TaxID=106004 RepID=A0A1Y2FGA9_9BASI|nr:hypothetical protein BCR35DRAFT_352167 [Leucosporidium creatinivorum]